MLAVAGLSLLSTASNSLSKLAFLPFSCPLGILEKEGAHPGE